VKETTVTYTTRTIQHEAEQVALEISTMTDKPPRYTIVVGPEGKATRLMLAQVNFRALQDLIAVALTPGAA